MTLKTAARKTAAQPLGLRERSKLDKQKRIKKAARQVFLEKGYENATTREIAAEADVAIGTLFVYARDKRDLLLMIVNDDLDEQDAAMREFAARDLPLLEQLIGLLRLRYDYWAKEPNLSRAAVQETSDFLTATHAPGEETARFYARRTILMDHLTAIVRRKQMQGRISARDDAGFVASLLMTIYLTEVRRWLTSATAAPDPAAGVERLGKLFALAMRGIDPAPEELGAD